MQPLASEFARWLAGGKVFLEKGSVAFRLGAAWLSDCFERTKLALSKVGVATVEGIATVKTKLEPATANGSEIALEHDFSVAGLADWRSHGQWKDSANRERNYWTASTAPAEIIWQMVTDLTRFAAWHPLISSTNVPYGQTAKPGLIYRVCSRYFPISTRVFVERVQPGELLSIRLFPFPGLQERVTYRIVSTICGTCVLYSITLSGWLSPLAWPMMKPHAVKVAAALVQAAEQETISPTDAKQRLALYNQQSDIF